MTERAPDSYADLVAVLDAMPMLIREKRRRLGLSQRAAARQAGTTDEMSVMRAERGDNMTLAAARTFLLWLGAPESRDIQPEVEP